MDIGPMCVNSKQDERVGQSTDCNLKEAWYIKGSRNGGRAEWGKV